ncbi:MAG: NYN domain-containing protein [Candidatus Scalinduaceae bacterium]
MDVIVDAYNVIFKVPELGAITSKCDIETLRERFLSVLRQYKAERKHKLTVVFDGKGYGASNSTRDTGIDVVFSRPGFDADEEIKRLVSNSSRPRQIIVVTSDRDIQQFVRRYGSKVVEPLEFYKEVKKKIASPSGFRHGGGKRIARDGREPISKYTGPSKSEAQYWLKVFKDKTGKRKDD